MTQTRLNALRRRIDYINDFLDSIPAAVTDEQLTAEIKKEEGPGRLALLEAVQRMKAKSF